MKRIILCAGLLVALSYGAEAQTKTKKTTTTKTSANKSTNKANTTTLTNTSTNAAKAPAIPQSSFGWRNTPIMGNNWQIADPVVRILNQRANGASTTTDFKDLMGVGRGTYGVANGHILLRPNGATTSGGITGSGAVGTGSTPGGVGTHGASLGVNGKNPYAGPAMWGTTGTGIGTNYQMTEASSNSIRAKKKD